MRKCKWIFTGLVCLGMAPAAWAGPSYSYVAVPEAGSVTVGNNVYDLYLQETVPSGSTAVVPGEGGLFGAGVAVVEQSGGTGVTVSTATNNLTSAPNGGNNTNFSTGGATNASGTANFVDTSSSAANVIEQVGFSNTGVFAISSSTVSGTTTNRYLLGTVTLNVSANANATFKVESLFDANGDGLKNAGSHGNTVTNTNFYDLDPNSTSPSYTGADSNPTSFTVTVSPVPEPASLAVFGIGAIGLLVRRRRQPV